MSKRKEPGRRRAQLSPELPVRLSRGLVLFALLAIAGAILAGVLLWQWSDDKFSGVPAADPGPVHVHGLGVNPADGALFIATHTGICAIIRDTVSPANRGAGGGGDASRDVARVVSDVSVLCPRLDVHSDNALAPARVCRTEARTKLVVTPCGARVTPLSGERVGGHHGACSGGGYAVRGAMETPA